jgi:hypothetical protein
MRIDRSRSHVAPTLVAARISLPPEGAHFHLGRPGGETLGPDACRFKFVLFCGTFICN